MAESHAEQEKKPFGIVLTEESTTADLGPDFICSSYRTSRQLWEVLVGKDIAGPMIEACASGDNSTLKILLAQPQWSKIMLEKQHFICDQDRERKDENDVRGVSGMAAQNLVRAIIIAAKNGHDTVVRTLLDFVSQQGIKFESVLWRDALMYTIKNGHVAVFDAMASAWPGIVNSDLLCHRRRPLYEALREDQAEIVAEMLRLGADVTPSADWGPKPLSFNCSLLSVAARSRKGTRLTEVLLEHGVPIKGSGALHTAAYYGRIDIMRLLIQYGADVDEKLQKDTFSGEWSIHHHKRCEWNDAYPTGRPL